MKTRGRVTPLSSLGTHRGFIRFLVFAVLFGLLVSGCAVSERTCVQNGTPYCRTRGNFTGRWYDYYQRALSCIEGDCLAEAEADLTAAIERRFTDRRRARTFGMHFLDYFPHRELGVVYFRRGRPADALRELELSLSQYPSDKAYHYLDEVRRTLLLRGKAEPGAPKLQVSVEGGRITRSDPVVIVGTARDEQRLIRRVTIESEPLLIGETRPEVSFTRRLFLTEGRWTMAVTAENLLEQTTTKQLEIRVDRSGPGISIETIDPAGRITGFLTDVSGVAALTVNGAPVPTPAGTEISFSVVVSPNAPVTLTAYDRPGNQTTLPLFGSKSEPVAGFPPPRAEQNRYAGSRYLVAAAANRRTAADAPDSYAVAAPPAIEIKTPGWNASETVWRKSIRLTVVLTGRAPVTTVAVNRTPVSFRPARLVSFSRTLRLSPGDNNVHIRAAVEGGETVERTLRFHRNLPAPYRPENRFAIALYPWTGTEAGHRPAVFLHRFAGDMLLRDRFSTALREPLSDLFRKNDLKTLTPPDPATVHGALLGTVHETRAGFEAAVRLVDVETREILAVADVYAETRSNDRLVRLAERLSKKLHRALPRMEAAVVSKQQDLLVIQPDAADFNRQQPPPGWPVIIHRPPPPPIPKKGADSRIIDENAVLTTLQEDKPAVVPAQAADQTFRIGDRVICR